MSFNDKIKIRSFFICSQKVAKINSLLMTKYALKSPKVSINVLNYSPKSSKSSKQNFRVVKVAKLHLFVTNIQCMPPRTYGYLFEGDRQTDAQTDTR